MLRVQITDYNGKTREESLKTILDCRYVICYKEDSEQSDKASTEFFTNKDELFKALAKDYENVQTILELYDGLVDKDSVSFLTKEFKENN